MVPSDAEKQGFVDRFQANTVYRPYDMRRMQVIAGYPNAEVVWCQEEPKNMGAWSYVKPRLETALRPENGDDGGGKVRSAFEFLVQKRCVSCSLHYLDA